MPSLPLRLSTEAPAHGLPAVALLGLLKVMMPLGQPVEAMQHGQRVALEPLGTTETVGPCKTAVPVGSPEAATAGPCKTTLEPVTGTDTQPVDTHSTGTESLFIPTVSSIPSSTAAPFKASTSTDNLLKVSNQ